MELKRKYIITTKQGGTVELFSDEKPYCCMTSIELTQHFKLSEAVAVMENNPSFWRTNGCKIHKIEMVAGEEVKV